MPNKSTKDKITALPTAIRERLFSYKNLINTTRDAENFQYCMTLKEMCKEYCAGLRDAGMFSKETANEIVQYITI